MGKHDKGEDLNEKPFKPEVDPELKAREFDEQFAQNQGKAKGFIERRKRRHGK